MARNMLMASLLIAAACVSEATPTPVIQTKPEEPKEEFTPFPPPKSSGSERSGETPSVSDEHALTLKVGIKLLGELSMRYRQANRGKISESEWHSHRKQFMRFCTKSGRKPKLCRSMMASQLVQDGIPANDLLIRRCKITKKDLG